MHGHDIEGILSLTAALEPGEAPVEPGVAPVESFLGQKNREITKPN